MFVKVAKLGEKVIEVNLADGATVNDAIRAAGVDAGGFELKLNGAPTQGGTILREADVITMVGQIKGGV